VLQCVAVCCCVLQCVAECCSVLQCVAVRCSVLQCVAVCCCVLQCVAVCCSALQCVAVMVPQSTRIASCRGNSTPLPSSRGANTTKHSKHQHSTAHGAHLIVVEQRQMWVCYFGICVMSRYFSMHELYDNTHAQRSECAPSHSPTYVKSVVDGVMVGGS